MRKGNLIVLAGGEGSGKTTCLKILKEQYFQSQPVVYTREPGGSELAEKLRNLLLENELNAFQELLLVNLSRSIHFQELVLPSLSKGINVICDRCYESTWAYQICAKQGGDKYGPLFRKLNSYSCSGVEVDLWIDFVIDVKAGLERRMMNSTEVNMFDKRPLQYHTDVRSGLTEFLYNIDSLHRVERVNASAPKEEVAKNVSNIIANFLHF